MYQDNSARIGLLFNNSGFAESLTEQLYDFVNYIPIVNVATYAEGEARLHQSQTFLVSDWGLEQLKGYCSPDRFAAVLLVEDPDLKHTKPGFQEAAYDNLSYIAAGDQMCEKVIEEIMSRVFPMSDDQQLGLALQNRQQLSLLEHIGKELSVFYHNISNPLTILSGNIQLLQMLIDSTTISDDLTKPIEDIAIVSTRFEQDLQSIVELREKIRAGNLQKEEV